MTDNKVNLADIKDLMAEKKSNGAAEPETVGATQEPVPTVGPNNELMCPKCQNIVFIPTVVLEKISALVSESGKLEIRPLAQPLMCVKCGNFMQPEDLGAQEPNIEEMSKTPSGIITH